MCSTDTLGGIFPWSKPPVQPRPLEPFVTHLPDSASHVLRGRRPGRTVRPSRTGRLVLVSALAVASIALAGCSSDAGSEASVTAGPTAASAPASGAELDAAGFAAALKLPGTTIVDVRTPAEFAEGHLPGAVNIDIASPDFAAQVSALDPSAPYAVYCRSGNRSASALAEMAAVGMTGAYHLGGGIGAWQSAGGEVVTG